MQFCISLHPWNKHALLMRGNQSWKFEMKYALLFKITILSETGPKCFDEAPDPWQCRDEVKNCHRKQDGWDCGMPVCIFLSFNLIFLFVSFRGGAKGEEKCPVAISDLVLIHNCVQEALTKTDAQVNNPNFNLWSLCSDLQMPYTKWSKAYKKRVENMLAEERILPESGKTEDHCTDVVVEGFVDPWRRGTKSSNQELKSKTIETQFLNEKKETYLQLSAEFATMRHSPKIKARSTTVHFLAPA